MANTSQTYSTETSIQNDFKIFLGKKSEIVEILANGKVVDRKWYLAWDTGEIFIGNKLHKLMKFGGTNEDMSSDKVKELIEENTKGNFNEIRRQMTKALSDYKTLEVELRNLNIEYSTTLANLNTATKNIIQEKITEVLSDYSNITYSKTDIDSKINRAVSNIQTYIQANFVSKNFLTENKYATETFVNDKVSGALLYVSGNTVRSNITNRVNGLFFSTSKSDDSLIERAHIYYLMNGAYEDMTPAGTGGGGGGVYVAPTLTLLYNNSETNEKVSHLMLELGSDFKGTRTFEWSCSNPAQISGNLSFQIPASNNPDNTYITLMSNISPNGYKKTISLTSSTDDGLFNPAEGEYSYAISGVDKQGTAVVGKFTINVVGPIYFGEGTSNVPDPIIIQAYPKLVKETVTGEYTVTINTTGRYAWICIPSTMNISGFALNGFRAPFEQPINRELTFRNIRTTYKCFRYINTKRRKGVKA